MKPNPLYTALVTPFNPDLTIDWKSLDRLVESQGENGLLLLGSTGEMLSMHQPMKEELIRYAGKLKKPYMVGVGGHDIVEQKRWIDFTLENGAASFLFIPPYYTRPGTLGQIHWYQTLMDHAKAPSILYNNPGRAASPLYPEVLSALKGHPHLLGLKEASGSLEDFRALKKAAPEILFFVGNDNLMWELAHLGATGMIAVMSNLYPKLTRDYVLACLKGTMNDLIAKAAEAAGTLSRQNPLSIKVALQKKGIIAHSLLLPPLDSRDLAKVDDLEKALQLLDHSLSHT